MRGLGDHDNITLEQEAQGGLCGGFAVLLADLGQNGVGEHILAAFRKRAPGFDLAAVFLEIFFGRLLLLKHMCFDLVDGRLDLREVLDVQIPVRAKVGNADRAEPASLVQFFHCAIGTVIITERLVDEQQIEIIGAQLAHGFLNGGLRFFIACVCDPDLGGQEKFLAGQTGLCQRFANTLLVVIRLRRINAAIAHVDGVQHAASGILRRGLIHAIAQFGHLDSIIQSYIFHDHTSIFLKS